MIKTELWIKGYFFGYKTGLSIPKQSQKSRPGPHKMDLDFQYCLEGKTHSIAELPNTDLDICGYFGRVTSHIIIMNILVCFQ